MPRGLKRQLAEAPKGSGLALCAVLVLLLAHYLFGGQRSEVAMSLAVAEAMLLGAALLSPSLCKDLARLKGLGWVAGLFGLVVAAALWSMTPWVPGGPHPAWSYTGQVGSASIDPSATFVEIVNLLGFGCMFLVGASLGASDRRARATLSLIVLGSALFAAGAFLAFVSGAPNANHNGRLSGHFLAANTAATLLGVSLTLCVAAILRKGRQAGRRERIASVAPMAAVGLILFIALVLTASRAGLAASMVAVVALLLAEALKRRVRIGSAAMGAAAVLVVLCVLLALAGDQILTRYFRLSDDVGLRETMLDTYWRAFLDSPVNGYGLGAFEAINRALLTPANFNANWNVHSVHNVYVQWLGDAGLAGALPMFATIGFIMIVAARGALRRERMTGWLFALLACDLIVLLHGWTDFAVQVPSFAAFWALLLGLQFSLAQGSRRASSNEPQAPVLVGSAATGLAAAAAAAVLIALSAGGSVGMGSLQLLRLNAGLDRAAEKALSQGVDASSLAFAEQKSRAALSLAPYDTGAWARLAYIDAQRHGRLTSSGLNAFARSYDLVAYDPYTGLWRIGFALEHWRELSPELRKSVQAEATLLGQSPPHRRGMRATLNAVQSPTGKMVAAFWLNQVEQSRH